MRINNKMKAGLLAGFLVFGPCSSIATTLNIVFQITKVLFAGKSYSNALRDFLSYELVVIGVILAVGIPYLIIICKDALEYID